MIPAVELAASREIERTLGPERVADSNLGGGSSDLRHLLPVSVVVKALKLSLSQRCARSTSTPSD